MFPANVAVAINVLPHTAVIAAQCCRDVYTAKDGGILERLDLGYKPTDGFFAKLYGLDDGYLLAFRGTKILSALDWLNNVEQALSIDAGYYDQAKDLSQKIKQLGKQLLLVGHSLGGGLAACSSYYTGCAAITFNAAGLSDRYKVGTPGAIINYFIPGDVLTTVQNDTSLPKAAGEQVEFDPPTLPDSAIARHNIKNFLPTYPVQTPGSSSPSSP